MNVYYSPDYVGSAYAFETTRKAKWVADSLLRRRTPHCKALLGRKLLSFPSACYRRRTP